MSPVEVQVGSGLPRGQGLWGPQTWVWQKPRRSPLTPPYSCRTDDPQTAKQLYQINSHTIKKVLGPTTEFPIWGSDKWTEKPQGRGLWRPVGFDYRTYTGLGKETLGGHRQNLACTRTQEKGAVTPQETDPDLPGSVQESPAEARVRSTDEAVRALVKEVAIIFITSTMVWSQVKQLGGNTAPPINRKLD